MSDKIERDVHTTKKDIIDNEQQDVSLETSEPSLKKNAAAGIKRGRPPGSKNKPKSADDETNETAAAAAGATDGDYNDAAAAAVVGDATEEEVSNATIPANTGKKPRKRNPNPKKRSRPVDVPVADSDAPAALTVDTAVENGTEGVDIEMPAPSAKRPRRTNNTREQEIALLAELVNLNKQLLEETRELKELTRLNNGVANNAE